MVPDVPVAGKTLILGIDRFMAECRSLTHFIGNVVATVVVSRWGRQLDEARLHAVLGDPDSVNGPRARAAAGRGVSGRRAILGPN